MVWILWQFFLLANLDWLKRSPFVFFQYGATFVFFRLPFLFLVGAFLVKRAGQLQWLVYFSSDYSLIAYMPHYVSYSLLPKVLSTWFWTHPNASTLKCKTQKGPHFQFFGDMRFSPPLFRLCETFFKVFWSLQRVPPPIFFVFCNWMDVEKI